MSGPAGDSLSDDELASAASYFLENVGILSPNSLTRCRLRIAMENVNTTTTEKKRVDGQSLEIVSCVDGADGKLLRRLRFLDVIGCSYAETEKGDVIGFHIHWYPVEPQHGILIDGWPRRVQRQLTIRVRSGRKTADIGCHDKILRVVNWWLNKLQNILSNPTPPHLLGLQSPDRTRLRYLILVNPNSGQGKSMEILQEEVAPMLSEGNVSCQVIVTERHNHAKEVAESLNLDEWDGVVIASGDGLVFEVLNGFMMRSDRERALRCPLAVIPTGSGNSLAATVCYQCCQPFSSGSKYVKEMTLSICRPLYVRKTLIHLETPNINLASFLSVGWGLMPDCDILSEWYRCIGKARFDIEGIWRILLLHPGYRGRLSYLPVRDHPSFLVPDGRPIAAQEYVNGTKKTRDVMRTPNRYIKQCPEFDFANVPTNDNNNAEPVSLTKNEDMGDVWRRNYIDKSVPRLDEPIPDDGDWQVMEEDFVFVYAAAASHLGSTITWLPWAQMDENVMYLTVVPRGICNRFQVFDMMARVDTAGQLDRPFFQIVPVRAFRLEPLTSGSMTVDGELIPTTPIQATITNYSATIIGKKP